MSVISKLFRLLENPMASEAKWILRVAPLITIDVDFSKKDPEEQTLPRPKGRPLLLPEEEALLWARRWKWLAITGTILALTAGVLIGRFLIP
jgi:hypothetical protein